jgi:hypothetical protein
LFVARFGDVALGQLDVLRMHDIELGVIKCDVDDGRAIAAVKYQAAAGADSAATSSLASPLAERRPNLLETSASNASATSTTTTTTLTDEFQTDETTAMATTRRSSEQSASPFATPARRLAFVVQHSPGGNGVLLDMRSDEARADEAHRARIQAVVEAAAADERAARRAEEEARLERERQVRVRLLDEENENFAT